MHVGGFVGSDRPDPMEGLRKQAADLGLVAAGLAPQRHLEDWGVSGLQSSSSTTGAGTVVNGATVSRMYTVWRDPEHPDSDVNLLDIDDERRVAAERPMSDGRPAWIVRQVARMRYPTLWEAVWTHWFNDAVEAESSETEPGDLLVRHVDHVLHNQFRREYGLGDPGDEGWQQLVSPRALQPTTVLVDGEGRDGLMIDTDAFVVGLATRLDQGRVLTAALPRDLLDYVELAFVGDAS